MLYFSAPLRCYICVTDYDDSYQGPGCSISSRNVRIGPCAVEHGFDRCISYRARNTRTGKVVFRRHCATRQMCEYECLFSHHENCHKKCCYGDLCNDASMGIEPGVSSTSTQNPKTRPDPTEDSESTRDPIVTTKTPIITTILHVKTTKTPIKTTKPPIKTTKAPIKTSKTTKTPVNTDKVSTTHQPLVGGPPSKMLHISF